MKPISAKEFIVAGAIGFLVGLRLLGPGFGFVYLGVAGVCIYYAFKDDLYRLFTVLPYLIYTEVFIHGAAGVSYVPYLFMEYFLMALFVIMLLRKGGEMKLHSRCAFPLFLYAIIETLDMIRTEDVTYARNMLTFTYLLLVCSLWASANIFNAKVREQVVKHVLLAGVYIAGNILVAHFTHNITYSLVSSSEATNRMAPVQISAYLGVSCSMLFLYIMNDQNRKQFTLNVIVFTIILGLMVLTFSRGGLYFLSSVIALYIMFNFKQIGKMAVFLLFVPIGYMIYYYAMSATDGKIEARYVEKGNSGRTELVEAGFSLLADEPLVGVGTGNYGKEIVDRELYGSESGAHNEFVRAAAEHGILGILCYWGFYIIIGIEFIMRRKKERDFSLYILLLFCLIIVHNGMKLGLQPFILAIALSTPTLVKSTRKQHAAFPIRNTLPAS